MSEKHIRQVLSEIVQQHYLPTEQDTRKSKLFKSLSCPYCSTPLNSLEELVVNTQTGLGECPMCIEISRAELGERQ